MSVTFPHQLQPSYEGFAETYRDIDAQEKLNWLRLIRTEHIGPMTFYNLLGKFKTAGHAIEALPEFWAKRNPNKKLRLAPVSEIEKEWHDLEAMGGQFLFAMDDAFPALLKQIDDCPPVLACLGNPALFQHPAVALVGSRNASMNGCKMARILARDLGQEGFTILSGMARGIDAAAHEGSLETGTIAVLGGGLNHIYPRENAKLYDRIRAQGLILSENPLNQIARAIDFPRRNRIVSGISQGVVVVEATLRSGSLITARIAAEQGREVFAVPGTPLDPRSEGANSLIREGATLIEKAAHIREALSNFHIAPKSFSFDFTPPEPAENNIKKNLETIENKILSLLDATPCDVDDILRLSGMTPPDFMAELLDLELSGLVARHPGNKISLL